MKLSIVTPTYNSEEFLRETIESVVSQRGDFEVEYIIVDNCSSDTTKDIVASFQKRILLKEYEGNNKGIKIIFDSVSDNGMYDAIARGLSRSTGDIQAWINSDDYYQDDAFKTVVETFKLFPDKKWIKGITSYISEGLESEGTAWTYSRDLIMLGAYGRELYFIQQDSVFWKRELYNQSEGIDRTLKLAGDYSLWLRFSRFAELITIEKKISVFRRREGQKSQDIKKYLSEAKIVKKRNFYESVHLFFIIMSAKILPLKAVVKVSRLFFNYLFVKKVVLEEGFSFKMESLDSAEGLWRYYHGK